MKSLLLLCALAAVGAAGAPCLWDRDTLDDELRGLPDAFDLAVGRFHRHGEAYYRARIAVLTAKPQLALADYDDLAVAHEHLGERAQAIEVMQRKAKALAGRDDAEQRYRYHANLGTFYAHDGRYDEALVELEQAVAIRPDAHFGRESYQIGLIRFARDAKAHPEIWGRGWLLRDELGVDEPLGRADPNEAVHVLALREPDEGAWQQAYTAVGAMLRFGGREGPELYRSLGVLHLGQRNLHLAWWSLQHAIERGHPAAAGLRETIESIEAHWREAEDLQASLNVVPTVAQYQRVRAATDAWVAAFQDLETAAIARGEDVSSDEALRQLLAAADARVPRPQLGGTAWKQFLMLARSPLAIAAVAGFFAVVLTMRQRRNARLRAQLVGPA